MGTLQASLAGVNGGFSPAPLKKNGGIPRERFAQKS
jgi:hypothetical protein